MRPNRPKKRQKEKQKHEDNQTDASQADRELFLQAFESNEFVDELEKIKNTDHFTFVHFRFDF
jgi:hypothetical protein